MPWFRRDPQDAIDQELSQYAPGRGAFTSDLTGQEFWLVLDKGYRPLGLVVGNCVFSMGAMRATLAGLRVAFRGEVRQMSQLLYDARGLAMKRMKDEADRLGADGIVGVDLRIQEMHNGEVIEVTAVGTAVKYVGYPEGERSRGTVVVPAAP
jgi:uncharacterized protein YbjQ (UPF0145 family)